MKFRTQSGSQYIFVDGQLTRLSEEPAINSDGQPIPADMTWEVPAKLIYPETIQVGSKTLFETIHGRLRTSLVTEVTE